MCNEIHYTKAEAIADMYLAMSRFCRRHSEVIREKGEFKELANGYELDWKGEEKYKLKLMLIKVDEDGN